MRTLFFWDVTQCRLVVTNHQSLDCLTTEDGADRLYQNVSNYLPIYAA